MRDPNDLGVEMPLSAKWTSTVAAGKNNSVWTTYDSTIKAEIDDYNRRFDKTPGFSSFDWKIFKAALIVESGGPANAAWATRPMQIGNPGDAAYGVLRRQGEGSSIVMGQQLKSDIKTKPINDPALNVRAGIAYVLTRAVHLSRSMQVDDPAPQTHMVRRGESLSSIALAEGTTMADLAASNPGLKTLHLKDVVTFHHTHMTQAISGWDAITPEFLQDRYNVGDGDYAEKIKFVLANVL